MKSPNPVITPATDAKPRDIVLGFLENNAANDAHHAAARAFLTPDMASRWVDDPVTVFKDAKEVKGFDPSTDTVTVTGFPVGSIDENGIYTPALSAASGAPITIQYRLGSAARASGGSRRCPTAWSSRRATSPVTRPVRSTSTTTPPSRT